MSLAARAILRVRATPSTMDEAHRLAQGGAPAGTAVAAEEQTEGRGSRGRRWTSPRGGLWLTVLARPATTGLELLSLRAGLAVAQVLDRLGAGDRIRIKWPNDLMLDERKTGGILCEARWQGPVLAWVAIGLGLNVSNAPPAELEATGTCLTAALPGLTPEDLLDPVVEALREVEAGPGPLTDAERIRFTGRDWLRGRELLEPEPGTAAGIAADGALLVRRTDGEMVQVRAGTVVVAHGPRDAGES
jgi:BirA family biotin operon repressor/biotin-[acetyl-CoA-carboxylase] ligase